jgi:uncharacterized protein (TIGR02466 family)
MEKQVTPAFPTLIGRFRMPDAEGVNQVLRLLLLAKERAEPNTQHANVGGWHSRHDVLDWPDPAVATLRGWIIQGVQHMIATTFEQMRAGGLSRAFSGGLYIYGWGNISRRGNYHSLHNHPASAWSGVYYVQSGDAPTPEHPYSGNIDLLDPRPFTEMVYVPGEPYGQKFSIRPESGTMIIFPGFLYHFVHPYMGADERISIAFNARADRKAVTPKT